MSVRRRLIVNADDFGQSPGVNRGINRAHERGLVTSASLMVRWPAAGEAAAYSREHLRLSVGLHVDLGEWTCEGEVWAPKYEVTDIENAAAVRVEVARQVTEFCHLLGRPPTHLDSHQHVHRHEPVRSVLADFAGELRVPLRHFSGLVTYCGSFYGQSSKGLPYPHGISVPWLLEIMASLPAGVTEMACHPGDGADVDSMYRGERADEVKTLCDPRARERLAAEEIELCSFHDLLI